MRFAAAFQSGETLSREYHSMGGGAIIAVGEQPGPLGHNIVQPLRFSSGAELLDIGKTTGLSWAPSRPSTRHTSPFRGMAMILSSLDAVIETMRQTGDDMQGRYTEAGLGGLAVNVVEC